MDQQRRTNRNQNIDEILRKTKYSKSIESQNSVDVAKVNVLNNTFGGWIQAVEGQQPWSDSYKKKEGQKPKYSDYELLKLKTQARNVKGKTLMSYKFKKEKKYEIQESSPELHKIQQ